MRIDIVMKIIVHNYFGAQKGKSDAEQDVEKFLGFRKFSQKFRKFSKILASMGSVK